MKTNTIHILSYAINGLGAGHLVRLLSINRWIRAYLLAMGYSPNIMFLTTSEFEGLLFRERFASIKIPSTAFVASIGGVASYNRTLATNLVKTTFETFRPDLFICDTLPGGSFGEFLPEAKNGLFSYCRWKAFIYRPVRHGSVDHDKFNACLACFDRIFVPEFQGNVDINIAADLRSKLRYVGPIISVERNHLGEGERARSHLGLQSEEIAVYVCLGGGGHGDAQVLFETILSVLAQTPGVRPVVALGPLYRGPKPTGQSNIYLSPFESKIGLAAADLAITAAGYNTFNELMHLGIPTIFVPLPAQMDDQHTRAMRAVSAGAAVLVQRDEPDLGLPCLLKKWRDPLARRAASNAAAALVPTNCAKNSAEQILSLVINVKELESSAAAVSLT